MNAKAWIAGCLGSRLSADERRFFEEERPFGFILFRRNIEDVAQLATLVAELKATGSGRTVPVFVDQEGGRIQRLRPPLAPNYPAARELGAIFERDAEAGLRASWLQGRLLAADLLVYGIDANCLPCLDVPIEGGHDVIGDRAYSNDPFTVAAMGLAAARGLTAGGVLPVMKHVPGHGRGMADSHKELPVVDTDYETLDAHDFRPFSALRDLPAAMSAHLLFRAIDPLRPATLSAAVIEQIVRGRIGFDGLLLTDDISMKALDGDFADLSRDAIAAGCDIVLHCNGDPAEMESVASAVPPLVGRSAERAAAALAVIEKGPEDADVAALRAEFAGLTGVAV